MSPSLRIAMDTNTHAERVDINGAGWGPYRADPRTDQRHLESHAVNLSLLGEARRILAKASQSYPGIQRALAARCGGADLPRPPNTDFPPVVVCEAAREMQIQEAALQVLLASARAEAPVAGVSGAAAIAALSGRFDEKAAACIERGRVICEISPLDHALGVFPVAQLALSLYLEHHSPSVRTGPDVVAISKAMTFTVGGQFDPNSAPEKLAVAIHELEHTNTEFEVSTVYLNVLNALGAAKSAAFTLFPEDGGEPMPWNTFVHRVTREGTLRRAAKGNVMGYTLGDLKTLMREIEDFGDAWRRERAEQAHLLTAVPSHCPVLIAPEQAPAVMLQTNARDTAIAHLAEALLLIQAGQAPLVLGVVGAPTASWMPAGGMLPVLGGRRVSPRAGLQVQA